MNDVVNIIFNFSEEARSLEFPKYATPESAGFDLRACNSEPITVYPGTVKAIPLGIRSEIPKGYEIQIRSRSGLAYKNNVFVLNSPGTVDSDFRGEWFVILANLSEHNFIVKKGDRIAQGVINKVYRGSFKIFADKSDLSKTDRGEGGFGHTGIA